MYPLIAAVILVPVVFLGCLFLALELLTRAIALTTDSIGKITVTVAGAVGEQVRGPVEEVPDAPETVQASAFIAPWEAWGDDENAAEVADPTYAAFPDPVAWEPATRTVSVRPGQGPQTVDMSAEGFEG